MNLNMIRLENETEDLLLSFTKICETLIKQTHTQPQETLEVKLTNPRQTFSFKLPIQIEGAYMIGLTGLEIYKSIFNIMESNNKFELYSFFDSKSGRFSYEKVRDEFEEDFEILEITPTDLQDEIKGAILLEEYRK